MNIIIVTVRGVDHNGEIIADKIEVITNDPDSIPDLDIVEYYKRRFPLTTKAMGL